MGPLQGRVVASPSECLALFPVWNIPQICGFVSLEAAWADNPLLPESGHSRDIGCGGLTGLSVRALALPSAEEAWPLLKSWGWIWTTFQLRQELEASLAAFISLSAFGSTLSRGILLHMRCQCLSRVLAKMGRQSLAEFLGRLLWKWLRKSGGYQQLLLGICFVCNWGSQGGRECLEDGKKPPAESGWRPLWRDWTVWAGVWLCCLLSLWKGACNQQHCGQQRSSLRDSWEGGCFSRPYFGLLLWLPTEHS